MRFQRVRAYVTVFALTIVAQLSQIGTVLTQLNASQAEFQPPHFFTSAKHVIFYNGYANPGAPIRSMRVYSPHFELINKLVPDAVIHFTTIAYNGTDAILSLCKEYNFTCQHLEYYESGFESLTLDHLHTYCKNHPDDIVTYLHPKGSYNARREQALWRDLLTEAALSSLCLDALREDHCNLCALTFHWIWVHLVPGTMWSGRCDYIQQQMSPIEYTEVGAPRLAALEQNGKEQGTLRFTLFREDRPAHGLDRWAAEDWVAQHPYIRPCDCSNGWEFFEGWRAKNMITSSDFVLRQAPATENPVDVHARRAAYLEGKSLIANDTDTQLREYFFLAGHILNWHTLYNQTPPVDSWVWEWYPHGVFWRTQLDKLGAKQAVDVVLATNWTEVCERATDWANLPCEPEWVGWKS